MRGAWLILGAALFVAGCGDSDNATITIDTGQTEGGDHSEKGKFSIKSEGFNLDLDIPSIALSGSDVNIDGLGLYPGAKIDGLAIDAETGQDKENLVKISFEAPDDAKQVVNWYATKMRQKDYRFKRLDDGLSGTNADGEHVEIKAMDTAEGGSRGKITIRDPNAN